jgi:hypothetical protein
VLLLHRLERYEEAAELLLVLDANRHDLVQLSGGRRCLVQLLNSNIEQSVELSKLAVEFAAKSAAGSTVAVDHLAYALILPGKARPLEQEFHVRELAPTDRIWLGMVEIYRGLSNPESCSTGRRREALSLAVVACRTY